jgi:hypothetical protein
MQASQTRLGLKTGAPKKTRCRLFTSRRFAELFHHAGGPVHSLITSNLAENPKMIGLSLLYARK